MLVKQSFEKKKHLTKENNPDFKLPLLNFIEFGTLCNVYQFRDL